MIGIPMPKAILSLIVRCLSSCRSASQELVGVGSMSDVELAVDTGRGFGGGVGVSVTVAVTVGGEEDSVEDAAALEVSALSELDVALADSEEMG
jgi:hypothetical protein